MQTILCALGLLLAIVGAQRVSPRYRLDDMPTTSFDCRDKILGGYYADVETDCQMFHVCVKVAGVGVQDYRFLCPNETSFDQENQICADWLDVDCQASTLYYSDNFDLYRIGHNPSTQRAPPREDEDYFLQRSETGDRRSKQGSGQELFRGSSSSNFFNSQNGKEDEYAGQDSAKQTTARTYQAPRRPAARLPFSSVTTTTTSTTTTTTTPLPFVPSQTTPVAAKKKGVVRKLRKRPQQSEQEYESSAATFSPTQPPQQPRYNTIQRTAPTTVAPSVAPYSTDGPSSEDYSAYYSDARDYRRTSPRTSINANEEEDESLKTAPSNNYRPSPFNSYQGALGGKAPAGADSYSQSTPRSFSAKTTGNAYYSDAASSKSAPVDAAKPSSADYNSNNNNKYNNDYYSPTTSKPRGTNNFVTQSTTAKPASTFDNSYYSQSTSQRSPANNDYYAPTTSRPRGFVNSNYNSQSTSNNFYTQTTTNSASTNFNNQDYYSPTTSRPRSAVNNNNNNNNNQYYNTQSTAKPAAYNNNNNNNYYTQSTVKPSTSFDNQDYYSPTTSRPRSAVNNNNQYYNTQSTEKPAAYNNNNNNNNNNYYTQSTAKPSTSFDNQDYYSPTTSRPRSAVNNNQYYNTQSTEKPAAYNNNNNNYYTQSTVKPSTSFDNQDYYSPTTSRPRSAVNNNYYTQPTAKPRSPSQSEQPQNAQPRIAQTDSYNYTQTTAKSSAFGNSYVAQTNARLPSTNNDEYYASTTRPRSAPSSSYATESAPRTNSYNPAPSRGRAQAVTSTSTARPVAQPGKVKDASYDYAYYDDSEHKDYDGQDPISDHHFGKGKESLKVAQK